MTGKSMCRSISQKIW